MQAKGAILLDWEGESVVHYGLIDEYDLKVIGAYQVIIHNFLKNIKTQAGLNFFQIKYEKMIAQFMPITKDYFVMLIFDNKELASKALYYLEKVAQDFKKEIG
ncbi:MAG: hypothetical protein N2202_02795 [Proteobacteria bacterium]|nr:hypothetical protein [Pseudomonadota bacterium]